MRVFKAVYTLLFLAVIMLAAKPFLGFNAIRRVIPQSKASILVKAFTKRKQEYNENSEHNIQSIQQRLANPVAAPLLLISFLLMLFPAVFTLGRIITNRTIADISNGLFNPQPRYLLAGQLVI